jgi:hypothetical protein
MSEHGQMIACQAPAPAPRRLDAPVIPDLDDWLAEPNVRVSHRRSARVEPDQLWEAARTVRLSDTRVLGRLVRWRIPGVPRKISFDELFRSAPFAVLSDQDHALVSGLVGRIWTLRRDYPQLASGEQFRSWTEPGTARVLFANWVESGQAPGAVLCTEVRVSASDREGRIGLAAVRPLIAASHNLIASEGIAAAVRLAERRYRRAEQ